MAGAVVHEKFFSDCITKSSLDSSKFNQNNCNVYSQGHDLLLYMETWNFVKNRQISLLLSNHRFQHFIYNYLKIAMGNESIYEISDVKAFLYGYISHHILDSYFHPYIMQYCGDYLPVKNKEWIHGVIETIFDSSFIKKYYNADPVKFKIHKDFDYTKVESASFIDNINQAGLDTYNIDCLGKKINIALSSLDKYMYLYRYDPVNFKKTLGRIAECFITLGAEGFFYDEKLLCDLDKYSNNDNKEWIYHYTKGTSNEVKSTDSFDDMYNRALDVTLQIINDLEEVIKGSNVSFNDLTDIIPDRSAITGVECGFDLPFVKKKRGIRYE